MTPSQDKPSPENKAGTPAAAPQQNNNPAAAQPGEGTEPRAGERLGHPTSQGLSGAQGSGGGADRGIQQAPTRPNHQAVDHQSDAPGVPPASDPTRKSEGMNR